jgi:hypothetical protein
MLNRSSAGAAYLVGSAQADFIALVCSVVMAHDLKNSSLGYEEAGIVKFSRFPSSADGQPVPLARGPILQSAPNKLSGGLSSRRRILFLPAILIERIALIIRKSHLHRRSNWHRDPPCNLCMQG